MNKTELQKTIREIMAVTKPSSNKTSAVADILGLDDKLRGLQSAIDTATLLAQQATTLAQQLNRSVLTLAVSRAVTGSSVGSNQSIAGTPSPLTTEDEVTDSTEHTSKKRGRPVGSGSKLGSAGTYYPSSFLNPNISQHITSSHRLTSSHIISYYRTSFLIISHNLA